MTYQIKYVFQIILIFHIVPGKNESKILVKRVSCKCECKLGGRKWNADQKWNNDKCRCECEERHICEKDYI